MDERQNRVLNLEPISSSFLVEDILRRGATSVFESPMENPSEKIKNEDEIDVHTAMGYDALTASSGNQEFTGLSCMVAEAEIKGAREFAKGIKLLEKMLYQMPGLFSLKQIRSCFYAVAKVLDSIA